MTAPLASKFNTGDTKRQRALERLVREQGALQVAKLLVEAIRVAEVSRTAATIAGALRTGIKEAESL